MPETPPMDAQELDERKEAASMLDERHLVDFVDACVEESREATKDIRRQWNANWKASENEMDFSGKEDWQAQIALDKPFATVQSAKSIVRKALVDVPKYWECKPLGKSPQNKIKCELWDKSFEFWLGKPRLNFPVMFSDACDLAFRIGMSHYLKPIPRLEGDRYRIDLHLIEPWKVHRDPDTLPRQPHSGLYLIHEDYVDYHLLLAGEQDGRYQGVSQIDGTKEASETTDEEASKKRKQLAIARNKFRKSYLVREFHGDVLGTNGELILPNATFTVCGQKVIRGPFHNPRPNTRFGMVAFSPLPHPLRWDGKGLLDGVRVLWHLMNQLFSLHVDNLNWSLNKAYEVNLNGLVDPTDTERFPGKWFYTKTVERVFHELDESNKTPEALANLDAIFQFWQEFSFVSEFTAGIPQSDNRDRTAKETEIKTNRALGVFESIGTDLEAGMVWFFELLYEQLLTTWDVSQTPEVEGMFEPEEFMAMWYGGLLTPQQRQQSLHAEMDITVTGVSAFLAKQDVLSKLRHVMEMASHPLFASFYRPYEIARVDTETLDLDDAGILKTEEEIASDQLVMQKLDIARGVGAANQPPTASGPPKPAVPGGAPSTST